MEKFLRLSCIFILLGGCSATNPVSSPASDTLTLEKPVRKAYIPELSGEVAVFDEVAIGLGLPLRKYLNDTQTVKGKRILDLGAGTGVLSLIALKNGASSAVATDINPNAVANAIYNAKQTSLDHKMEVRLVSTGNPGAYSVIGTDEKFDLIISNPPQTQDVPKNMYEYSYKDLKLSFLRSIIEGMADHLTPEGKGVFALNNAALEFAKHVAKEQSLEVNIFLKTKYPFGDYYVVEITRSREKAAI
jgi:methylase of polypeptide subunit release factors